MHEELNAQELLKLSEEAQIVSSEEQSISEFEADVVNNEGVIELPPLSVGITYDGEKMGVFCFFPDEEEWTARKLGLMLYLMHSGYFKQQFIDELVSAKNEHKEFVNQVAEAWMQAKEELEQTPEISSREVLKQFSSALQNPAGN